MILGIDLGQKTTGIAISEGQLASPYQTIKHKNLKDATSSIIQIIKLEKVDTVVIGFVEGKIKSFFEKFAKNLKTALPDLEVILWDETLTTRQATESMIKLGTAKLKRRQKEHEVSAALILQSYLDEQN